MSEFSQDGSRWFPRRYGPASELIFSPVVSTTEELEPDYTDVMEVQIRCEANDDSEDTERAGKETPAVRSERKLQI